MIKRLAAIIVLAGALLPAGAAHAQVPGGCYVYGEVLGLDTVRNCTYTATSTSQNVYIGTPYEWRIWVLRTAPNGQPLDVTLAEGTGPQAGLPVARPLKGETVHVSMFTGCTNPFCGTIGFLGAGFENASP